MIDKDEDLQSLDLGRIGMLYEPRNQRALGFAGLGLDSLDIFATCVLWQHLNHGNPNIPYVA